MPGFTPAEIAAFRESGRISAKARDWAAHAVKPGVLLRTVQEGVEDHIRQAGALPSFPAQTSVNEVAAHYCSSPSDRAVFKEGDLVKIDVGAHVDGYPTDTGITVDLSPDGRWAGLIRAASDALDAGAASLRDGIPTGEVGRVIEGVIKRAGFRSIANLTGHGLARWSLHATLQIPNVAQKGGPELRTGMVFAIEPFATTGTGLVTDRGKAEVFSQVGDLPPAGACDADLLRAIQKWRGLPVARRYFRDHPKNPFERCLRDLIKKEALFSYSPLVEISGAPVAWKEHSIYLSENGPEVLTA